MIALILCILSFVITFVASRRSLLAGLVALLSIGYFYGIIRANVPETLSHFIFDAGVVGLYINQLFRRQNFEQRRRVHKLMLWMGFLIGWPVLLFLIPIQDTLVELVGLRGNIFLLPFLLFGARLDRKDFYKLALCIAVLNLVAFGFAVAQFIFGVESFFPKNPVTEIIYMSTDATGIINSAYRIPSCFSSAHAYGGMMATSLVFLIGAWVQKDVPAWHRYLLGSAIIGSIIGTFMSAARIPVILLAVLLIVVTIYSRMRLVSYIGWAIFLIGIGWIVSSEERFQRFMTLQDTEYVVNRVSSSVNKSFFDKAMEYPLGNGLGGGGTSIPYFLRDRIKNQVLIENEYGRIMLEQGIPGLFLWVAFIVWAFTRRNTYRTDSWYLGRRLAWFACAVGFATALMGTGILTSIPGTCIVLILVGWIAVRQKDVNANEPASSAAFNRNRPLVRQTSRAAY